VGDQPGQRSFDHPPAAVYGETALVSRFMNDLHRGP
jgi:hypothetical protein